MFARYPEVMDVERSPVSDLNTTAKQTELGGAKMGKRLVRTGGGGTIGEEIILKTERNVSRLHCKDGERDKGERRWRKKNVAKTEKKRKKKPCVQASVEGTDE